VPLNYPALTRSAATVPATLRDPLILAAAALVVFVSIFPRAAAAVFLALCLGAAIVAFSPARRPDWSTRVASPLIWTAPIWTALAFAAWSMLTAAWSPAPWSSLSKPLYFAAGAAGLAIVAAGARTLARTTLWRILQGALLGLLIGGAILAIETLTDQALTRFFYNAFPSLRAGLDKQVVMVNGIVEQVKENNINRRATIITLLLAPALLTAALASEKWVRWGATALILVLAAILMRYSAHQSSQAAIVAATLAYFLARVAPRTALTVIAAAWVACCLLVVPMVMALHATSIHKNENGLFFSARHRIVIWNTTAEKIMKSPILGIGADATATVTEARAQNPDAALVEKDGQFTPDTARHAHNVYLQTWYELGAVGAVLLMALGLAALAAINRSTTALQPYLLAEFAAIAGMIAFSFSLWQVWFQGAIGLGVLILLIGQPVAGPGKPNNELAGS